MATTLKTESQRSVSWEAVLERELTEIPKILVMQNLIRPVCIERMCQILSNLLYLIQNPIEHCYPSFTALNDMKMLYRLKSPGKWLYFM